MFHSLLKMKAQKIIKYKNIAAFIILALLFQIILFSILGEPPMDIDFAPKRPSMKDISYPNMSFVMIYNNSQKSNEFLQRIENSLQNCYANDTGHNLSIIHYDSIENMYADTVFKRDKATNYFMGFVIGDNLSNEYLPLTIIVNDSIAKSTTNHIIQMYRIIWKALGLGDYDLRTINLEPAVYSYYFLMGFICVLIQFDSIFTLFELLNPLSIVYNYIGKYKQSYFHYWAAIFILFFLFNGPLLLFGGIWLFTKQVFKINCFFTVISIFCNGIAHQIIFLIIELISGDFYPLSIFFFSIFSILCMCLPLDNIHYLMCIFPSSYIYRGFDRLCVL